MKKFWKLLNKTEVKHLHEMGIFTVEAFKRTRSHQHDLEAKYDSRACFDCNTIASKIGMSYRA